MGFGEVAFSRSVSCGLVLPYLPKSCVVYLFPAFLPSSEIDVQVFPVDLSSTCDDEMGTRERAKEGRERGALHLSQYGS